MLTDLKNFSWSIIIIVIIINGLETSHSLKCKILISGLEANTLILDPSTISPNYSPTAPAMHAHTHTHTNFGTMSEQSCFMTAFNHVFHLNPCINDLLQIVSNIAA